MKNTKLRFLTAMLLTLIAFNAAGGVNATAQDSANALGEELVKNIRTKDTEALRALVDPEVVSYLGENDPGKLDKMLDTWVSMDISEKYEIVVKAPGDIENYDSASQTFSFGPMNMYFPVAPDNFLELLGEQETVVTVDGEKQVAKGMGTVSLDAARENGGKWYLVIPVMKK